MYETTIYLLVLYTNVKFGPPWGKNTHWRCLRRRWREEYLDLREKKWWRNLRSEELYNLSSSTNIVKMIISKKML
jgi:hypothetical protein